MSLEKTEVLPTGIEILDRKLEGGIPTGTVTVLSASPASQSELFLYEFAATRQTVYLATIRTEDAIEEVLDSRDVDSGPVDVIRVDEGDPIGHAERILADLPDRVNIVIDPVDVLETSDGTSYRWFLAQLKQRVTDTPSAAMVHCLRDESTPELRRNTLHLADLVLQLSTDVSGDSVVNRLTVPKFRSGQSVEEVIKLDMTSEVEVDLSRNLL